MNIINYIFYRCNINPNVAITKYCISAMHGEVLAIMIKMIRTFQLIHPLGNNPQLCFQHFGND